MKLRQNAVYFAAAVVALLLAPACWSQTARPPEFNTASAGVRPADVEAAVAAICPASDITRSKDGKVAGCRTCPKGTDFFGEKDSDWEMYAQTPGHFTSAQDNNLLLDGTGCDSHANNFGGSFLFSLKSGKPQLVRYAQGLVTNQCHKFAYADGRDFLVCRGGWTGQGENIEAVFMAAFDATGKDTSTNLIVATDTTGTCDLGLSDVVQAAGITDIKFATKPSGETTGMTVTARLGDVKCSQQEADEAAGKQPSGVGKPYPIEFRFDGKQFTVAPASAAALQRFDNN